MREVIQKHDMIQQQKAEAYVRTQIPELMVLPWHVVGPFESTGSKKGWFYAYSDENGTNRHSSVFETREEAEAHALKTHGQGQIIQLQHWLRVLRKLGAIRLEADTDRNIITLFLISTKHKYGTLRFNLTTGQPATEAYYKAFNDIVSPTTFYGGKGD